ncbi:MAG: metal-sulfur cluster assembly factor [Actinomycetota bacterium]
MSEENAPQPEETPKPGGNGESPTTEDVLEVLKMVVDPELGINVVDLGLVYEVDVDDDTVKVVYTLTSMGCPVGPLIEQQIQQVITTLPGVGVVESKCTFDPPWSMERMSEDARLAMGMF